MWCAIVCFSREYIKDFVRDIQVLTAHHHFQTIFFITKQIFHYEIPLNLVVENVRVLTQ